jgi:glycosyltransferase involved in cell wall biosynthesis
MKSIGCHDGRQTPRQGHCRPRDHRGLREFAQGCTVLSPSQFLADLAIKQGFGAVRVLPHGVAPVAHGSEKRSYLLFLGTMAPHKHPLLVRRAWQRAGRPVPLRLVGPAGPDAGYMAQLFAEDPRPEGAVGDVRAVLAGARALVLGSVWPENAPLVILEARAAGCPVIAPRIGGIPEIVPEDAGLLYAPGDEGALAEAILAVLGRSWEPEPPLSFEAHLDRLLAVYAGVLSKGVEAG